MSRDWEQRWFNPLEPFPLWPGSWTQPAGQVRQTEVTAAHRNCGSAPFSAQYGKKSPLILSVGLPVGLHLQCSTNPGGKGRKSGWLPGFTTGNQGQATKMLRPAKQYCTQLRPAAQGPVKRGEPCLAVRPQPSGAHPQELEDISLIWREGEHAEASTMRMQSSHSPLLEVAAVWDHSPMLLSMNFSQKEDKRALQVKYSPQSWNISRLIILALQSQKAQSWPAWAREENRSWDSKTQFVLEQLHIRNNTSHRVSSVMSKNTRTWTVQVSKMWVQPRWTCTYFYHILFKDMVLATAAKKNPHLTRSFNHLRVVKWVEFKKYLKQEFCFMFHS